MNRLAWRSLGALLLVGAWVAWLGSPAAAIETEALSIEPVVPDPATGRLALVAGTDGEAAGAVRVVNKTDQDLAVALEVVPARVTETGNPQLGGPSTVADRVRLERDALTLGPGAAQVIGVSLGAGDPPSSAASAAILASPAFASGEAPAVLSRVGLVLTVRQGDVATGALAPPDSGVPWPLTASALVLASATAALAVRSFTRRRRASSFLTANPAL